LTANAQPENGGRIVAFEEVPRYYVLACGDA
jgi:nitrous oxide reductase accessory protein NosL